ncbi:MAG: hypothetical protein HY608_05575 [Planctomycetes bacterium]|nr:hypothetical protein [Planctomycetota bacterium]
MTYRQILFLKQTLGMPTVEIARRFPEDGRRISVAALSELSPEHLRSLLSGDPPLLGEVLACKAQLTEE